MSLEQSDTLAAEGATAPRVTLHSMEARIAEEHYFTAGAALYGVTDTPRGPLDLLTLCVIVLDNEWVLLGKSAPASAENFDPVKGKIFAREDALRQLWPLEGYLLRDRLAAEQEN